MIIFNQQETEAINSDYISRIKIAEKEDSFCVTASISQYDKGYSILARYSTRDEAIDALRALANDLAEGITRTMPLGSFQEGPRRRDARVKRRGGS